MKSSVPFAASPTTPGYSGGALHGAMLQCTFAKPIVWSNPNCMLRFTLIADAEACGGNNPVAINTLWKTSADETNRHFCCWNIGWVEVGCRSGNQIPCTKFPWKHAVMIKLLGQVLHEEGGFDYKSSIVDNTIIIEEIIDAKEAGLSHLCEFIRTTSRSCSRFVSCICWATLPEYSVITTRCRLWTEIVGNWRMAYLNRCSKVRICLDYFTYYHFNVSKSNIQASSRPTNGLDDRYSQIHGIATRISDRG